jgi:hypothetical protein
MSRVESAPPAPIEQKRATFWVGTLNTAKELERKEIPEWILEHRG